MERQSLSRLGDVLASAFFDDPVLAWMMPDPDKRRRHARWLYRQIALYGHLYGQVDQLESGLGGAIWLLPSHPEATWYGMLRVGVWQAPFRMGTASIRRFLRTEAIFSQIRHRHVPGPHWYLATLGIDPSQQGKGWGGKLIQTGLAQAANTGVPCYLETAKARNLPFYERCGFRVIEEKSLPDGGPPFWGMLRNP